MSAAVRVGGDDRVVSAGRLLSMLLLLQSRGRLSARQLAEELEVSVRTAYRDLTRLQAAGIPVYAEAGRGGGTSCSMATTPVLPA